MNATVLALLDLNFPNWINKLDAISIEFFNIIVQHYRRLGIKTCVEVITLEVISYACHHDDYLVPATGKHIPFRAPRM
jgi:hypothetical protein